VEKRINKDCFNFILFCFSLLIILIAVFIVKLQNNDDADFQLAASKYNFFDFIYNIEYLKWSGRLIANSFLYFASKIGIWSYRLIAPLSILLTAYSISRIYTPKFNLKNLMVTLFSFVQRFCILRTALLIHTPKTVKPRNRCRLFPQQFYGMK
jgi:hypothetical protein